MNTAEDINKTIVLGEEKVTASAQEEDPEQSEKAGEEQEDELAQQEGSFAGVAAVEARRR